MFTRSILAACGLLAFAPAAVAQFLEENLNFHGHSRARGEDPCYHVNQYGFGNYVQGPNGSYGGYPAGSAGAIELQNEHDLKCRYAPETCGD